MKVIIATDGSAAAIEGAQRALGLLKSSAALLVVMVVPEVEDPMDSAGGFQGPVITEEEAEEAFEESVERGSDAVRRTAKALQQVGLPIGDDLETRLIASDIDAGGAIVEEANATGADLIVIGSSGKGTFRRLLSGSVSEHIVRHASCPVLVVRHGAD